MWFSFRNLKEYDFMDIKVVEGKVCACCLGAVLEVRLRVTVGKCRDFEIFNC